MQDPTANPTSPQPTESTTPPTPPTTDGAQSFGQPAPEVAPTVDTTAPAAATNLVAAAQTEQPAAQPTQSFGSFDPQATPPTPPKKSKAPLIVTIVIVALLLIGGGIAAAFMFVPKNDSSTGTTNNTSQSNSDTPADADSSKDSITAATLDDFSKVCAGSAISNAQPSAKPYKLMSFIQTGTDKYNAFIITDERLSTEIDEINAVLCLTPDTSTEKLVASNCSVKNLLEKTTETADAYTVTYDVAFYAPATGEVIGKTTTVTPSETACPSFGNVENGKVFVRPDHIDIKPALAEFGQ